MVFGALFTATAFSQGFSSLTARIADPSGGAIVGALVEATNLDTAAKRSASSDATGTVAMNQMVPGRYGIKATMTGFAIAEENVTLVINTPLRAGAKTISQIGRDRVIPLG